MTNFEMVGEFHRKFRLPLAPAPWEELDRDRPETYTPAALDHDTFLFRYQFLHEELQELMKAHRAGDLVAFADALADLVYVAYGTAHMARIPLDEVFAEVQRANLSKERATGKDDGRSKRGSALDVVKPDGWRPPDIAGVLARHGYEPVKNGGAP